MSVDRFKFVSPGVQINEIDNSQFGPEPNRPGPAIIGRFERGPSNRPIRVESVSDFIRIFGNPIPGGRGGDAWREGNKMGPTYAGYAALAYLRNAAPATIVRVLGEAHDDATSTSNGPAGWALDNAHVAATSTTPASGGGAYGLFLFSSGSGQRDHVGAFLGAPSATASAGANSVDAWLNVNSGNRASSATTGSLAAVWYFDAGAIELSGTLLPGFNIVFATSSTHLPPGSPSGGGHTRTFGQAAGNSLALRSSNTANMEFTAVLFDNANVGKKVTFNFDRNSDNYIRKVFNTNPALAGAQVSSGKKYWLGESFDRHARDMHGSTLHEGALTADSSLYGVIVGLKGTSGTADWGSNQKSTQPAKTGWFISQDVTSNSTQFDAGKQQKLFRLVALDDGAWAGRNIKVSISDHKLGTEVSPYGTFTVTLRHAKDTDGSPRVLERFSQCTLDPQSPNYIAAKIGNQYQEWDSYEQRYRSYNSYPNRSAFVRVEMDSDVHEGMTDAAMLPFGFFGPPRYKAVSLAHNGIGDGQYSILTVHSASSDVEGTLAASTLAHTAVFGSGSLMLASAVSTSPFKSSAVFAAALTASVPGITGITGELVGNHNPAARVLFPSLPLRMSASAEGLRNNKQAHFGVFTGRAPGDPTFDESYWDITRGGQGVPADAWDSATSGDGSTLETSFIFSLDDLVGTNAVGTSLTDMFYMSGSRKMGNSYTVKQSVKELVKSGFTNFTSPMYGGFDGLTVKERAPLGNHIVGADNQTFQSNAAANSIKRAIDSVGDPEVADINMICVPGVRAPLVTDHIIRVAEDRGDCLAIIDVENNGYQPSSETTSNFKTRITNNSVKTCVENLEKRNINSSYACTYFPWVKIRDDISNKDLWVPPSVVALGTFASTERNSDLWFAPAGFTRGGLSDGLAGVPVLSTSQRLSSRDRDDLYEANINPIATFPAEGIVIFGQKTLQVTPSALDRINVRRLVVFLKKEISRMASGLLFEPNVNATWNRFRGQVEPFLSSVKANFGLEQYRVVLDETTTTPDLVDRNIMYAKIFIKPAKALEFIAIDFIITNNGAAFDD